MTKQRTGYVYPRGKSWVARVTYVDNTGKQRSLRRSFPSKSQANAGLKQLSKDLDDKGSHYIKLEAQTFADLADYYEKQYLIEPVYAENRKVAGLRNHKDLKRRLTVLRETFGNQRLRELTYGDIEKFKREYLAKPTHRDSKRSLADVHRVLSLLRAMLKVAEREDWITRSPFGRGKPLINMADEKPRERILSRDEEARLLAACTGKRAPLRAVLICALDTGMRRGEIISLKWRWVDFLGNRIWIEAFNTKTMKGRAVPMSARLATELKRLEAEKKPNGDDLVFDSKGRFHNSLKRTCKEAGIEGFRFHDCRHTTASRLIQGGMPLVEVSRILGHSTLMMSYRYSNTDNSTVTRATVILDGLNAANVDDSLATKSN